MRRKIVSDPRSWLLAGLLLFMGQFNTAQAATVAVDTLLIDSASLTIAITGDGSRTYSSAVATPVEIIMGEYQDPIVQLIGGRYSARIYSTGDFGKLAPSGSVDTIAGTINVDFSSLRASATTPYGTMDMALWPLTNPPSGGIYDPGTGAYTLTWLNPFSVLVGQSYINGVVSISLSGTAAIVPVPAALWLLGSGLLGLAGIARRRKVRV